MTVKGEEEFRRTGRRKRELGLEERELLKEKREEAIFRLVKRRRRPPEEIQTCGVKNEGRKGPFYTHHSQINSSLASFSRKKKPLPSFASPLI